MVQPEDLNQPEPFQSFCEEVKEDGRLFFEIDRAMIDRMHIQEFHHLIEHAKKRNRLNNIIGRSVQIDEQFSGHMDKIWKILEERSTQDELRTISTNQAKLPLKTGLTTPLNKKIESIETWQGESQKFLTSGEKSEEMRLELIQRGRDQVSSDKYLAALEEIKYFQPNFRGQLPDFSNLPNQSGGTYISGVPTPINANKMVKTGNSGMGGSGFFSLGGGYGEPAEEIIDSDEKSDDVDEEDRIQFNQMQQERRGHLQNQAFYEDHKQMRLVMEFNNNINAVGGLLNKRNQPDNSKK